MIYQALWLSEKINIRPIRSVTALSLSLAVSLTLSTPAFAQNEIVAREGELPSDDRYVPVVLDSKANDAQSLSTPSEKVTLQGIPFQMVKKTGAGNLFLKSIGWSAAKDESAEYPGYIAKYDTGTDAYKDPMRAIFKVPVSDYAAFWMLAATDADTNLSDVVTFRLGVVDGQARATYHDFSTRVPRVNDAAPAGVRSTLKTPNGNVYLIRVPIGKSIAQDFRDRRVLDLDITKELRVAVNLPDPYRFQLRPLGVPSGVRIYALTLERAPAELELTSSEPGFVFNQPQTPTFHLKVHDTEGQYLPNLKLEAVARRDDGVTTTHDLGALTFMAGVYRNPAHPVRIEIPVKERGYYDLRINLKQGEEIIAYRETSFALLMPNTRKYRHESPFGTWDFGGVHYTANDPDLLGPLYVKLGLRYGMATSYFSEADRRRYGIKSGSDPRITGEEDAKALAERVKADPLNNPVPERLLTFHETAISGPHLTRTPDVFTGRAPYKMDEAEEKRFKEMQKEAEASFRAGRKYFPDAEIYFGNGVPHVPEEFFRRKWPRELVETLGNESGSFMRLPETQPLDFVPNNAGLWMFRQIADHYGYKDVPVKQCLEMCYPSTNPGNLSERTQANYFVRHMMHSLAWRVPVIRPGTMTDMGNSYHYSNWGATGFMRAYPHVRPKPSYVSFAVMTQMLDGAKFTRLVPTNSSVVYAVEFQKKDRSFVTCLWTLRGKRVLALQANGAGKETVTHAMGRESTLTFTKGRAALTISDAPLFLSARKPISSITPGVAKMEGRPTGKTFLISALDKLSDWTIEQEPSTELEVYNFMNPRRKGDFQYRETSFGGEAKTLEVAPKLPVPGSQYLQMYSILRHNAGVEIPGEPTEIGVFVHGNGGWGRLIFELEDAGGQRWISIGAEQAGPPNPWMADWLKAEDFARLKSSNLSDWNSDDAWGRSFINFEGWRYLRFPLPGNYPGEKYPWPRNAQWKFSGDGVVKYPLRFRKLIVTMPEKVLHATEYKPVARKEIYLKDLTATFAPVEAAFAAE